MKERGSLEIENKRKQQQQQNPKSGNSHESLLLSSLLQARH